MRRLIPSICKAQEVPDSTTKQQRRLPRIKLFFVAIFMIATTITGGYGVIERDQLTRDLVLLSGKLGLNLQYIQVTGRSHTPTEMLVAATDIKMGQPLLGIPLSAVHRNVTQIGWVESAIVERLMPSTIKITITERIPLALLQTRNGHELIDRKGAIIYGADPKVLLILGHTLQDNTDKIKKANQQITEFNYKLNKNLKLIMEI